MKRFLIAFMVLGMMFGAVATAEAKKRPTRAVRAYSGTYATPFVPFNAGCSPTAGRGCVTVDTRSTESSLTAKVTDSHGLPVFVQVWENTDGDGMEDVLHGAFCGETTEPISFPPGAELHFWVGFTYSYGSPYERCPGGLIATTGTVSVSLSNRP